MSIDDKRKRRGGRHSRSIRSKPESAYVVHGRVIRKIPRDKRPGPERVPQHVVGTPRPDPATSPPRTCMSLRATRAIDVDRISDMKKALDAHIARHQARAIENQSRQPRRLNSGRPKSILESALIEFANPAIIRALVQG